MINDITPAAVRAKPGSLLPGLYRKPPLVGSWYIAPPDNGWRQFASRFAKNYDRYPPAIASLSYEAMALTILLAGKGEEPDYSLNKLTAEKGFQGVRGIFRLMDTGEVERGLAIKQIKRRGTEIVTATFEMRRAGSAAISFSTRAVAPDRSHSCRSATMPMIVSMQAPTLVASRSVGLNASPLPWLSTGASVLRSLDDGPCVALQRSSPS